jgi:hypothetical protein
MVLELAQKQPVQELQTVSESDGKMSMSKGKAYA